MPPKVISGGDNPYDIHDAKLSSSATAHESSSVTAHEISNTRESNCLTKSFKRKTQIRSEIMDSISHLCVHDITLPVDNRGTEDKYLYCKAARHLWVSMPAPSSIFSISSYEAFFFASTLVTALPKP